MTLEDLIGQEGIAEIAGKPFGINPNSKYSEKEFLEAAKDLYPLEPLREQLTQNSGNLEVLEQLVRIELNYVPGDKARNVEILRNPRIAIGQATELLKVGNKRMVDYVARNIEQILKNISDGQIIKLAISQPKNARIYLGVEAAIAEGKIDQAKAIFSELFDDAVWKSYVARFNEMDVHRYLGIYVQKAKNRVILENFGEKEKTEDGKEKIIPDYAKARAYLQRIVSGLKSGERDQVYLEIGRRLYAEKAKKD